ncbi:MAG: hypothetical protein ACFCUI_08785 [Bernardetiaceae bacterium]
MLRFFLVWILLVSSTAVFAQSGQLDISTNRHFDLGWGLRYGVHNYFDKKKIAVVIQGRAHRYRFYPNGLPENDGDVNVLNPPHTDLETPYLHQEVAGAIGLRFDLVRNDRLLVYGQPNFELSMVDFRGKNAYLSDLGVDPSVEFGLMLPLLEGFSFQASLNMRHKTFWYQTYESSVWLMTLGLGVNYNISGFGSVGQGVFCPLADKGLMGLPNKEQAFLLEVPITTSGEVGIGARVMSYTRFYRAFYLSTMIRGSQVSVSVEDEDDDPETATNPKQRELATGLGVRWDFFRNDAMRVYLHLPLEVGIFRIAYSYPRAQTSKGHLATTPALGFITPFASRVRFQGELGFRYRFISQDAPDWRKSFIVASLGLAININD